MKSKKKISKKSKSVPNPRAEQLKFSIFLVKRAVSEGYLFLEDQLKRMQDELKSIS